MLFGSRRKRIVRRAVKRTVVQFKGSSPAIYKHLYYGHALMGGAPQWLVVWYIFETDDALEAAENMGLCDRIRHATVQNLLSLGYPQEAFDVMQPPVDVDHVQIIGGGSIFKEQLLFDMRNQKAKVCFTTHEDIVRKADGDYYLYFH